MTVARYRCQQCHQSFDDTTAKVRRPASAARWAAGVLLSLPLVCAAAPQCAVTTSNLNFGNYDTINPATSTTGIVVDCQGIGAGVAYTIALSSGSGSYATRIMNFGVEQLQYNLFTSAAFATVWGDGSVGTLVVADAMLGPLGNPPPRTYTVFGRIPGGQSVAPGSYATAAPILVTVTY